MQNVSNRVLRTSLVPLIGTLKNNTEFVTVLTSWLSPSVDTEVALCDPVTLWRVIEALVARTVLCYGYEDAWELLLHVDLQWLRTQFPAHLKLGYDGPFMFTCP